MRDLLVGEISGHELEENFIGRLNHNLAETFGRKDSLRVGQKTNDREIIVDHLSAGAAEL